MNWFILHLAFDAGWVLSRLVSRTARRVARGMTVREALKPTRGDRPEPPKVTEVA